MNQCFWPLPGESDKVCIYVYVYVCVYVYISCVCTDTDTYLLELAVRHGDDNLPPVITLEVNLFQNPQSQCPSRVSTQRHGMTFEN